MSNQDAVKRMLAAKLKQPEHKRLDIEPKIGGASLINDPKKPKVDRVSLDDKEIEKDPILIKASKPEEAVFKKSTIGSVPDVDDGFIPPKTNFVSVGNVDHAWYDDKVTGLPEEEIDVESLQGLNPLAEASDQQIKKSVEFFDKRLAYVKSFVATELLEVSSLEELKDLKSKVFGKKGMFTDILKLVSKAQPNERLVVGELINSVYSELQLEFEGKNFELTEVDENEEEWPEDMAIIEKEESTKKDSVEEGPSEEIKEESVDESADTIPEEHYAIILNGDLFDVVDNVKSARYIISDLILNNNVDIQNIQLLKRIKIDFGIILGE